MTETITQTGRWQLPGRGPESYQQFQVPSLFEPLADIFLPRIGLNHGQRVLDVACGTGVVARRVAPTVGAAGRVAAIDLNPRMIEVARTLPVAEGAPIDWRDGDAASLPYADAEFDVVICQQGLQFIPDRVAALSEMRRVLRPGGRLALAVWQSLDQSPCNLATADALERHVSPEAARGLHAPFQLGDGEQLRSLIAAAGFAEITVEADAIVRRMLPAEQSIPGHLASTPVGPQILELDEATRDALVLEVSEALAPYRDDEGLAIPQGTHIALATR
jgi:ubiquinone/menaquinone biosynthesis C-methylase UbiE